jgi:hypothetical protein
MRIVFALALLMTSMPAMAQSADALYGQACGPKDANFVVEQVKGQAPTSPAPGKALVFIIQKESSRGIFTRIGSDGSWKGVIHDNSYIPFSVEPGEHHLCAATQSAKHPEAQFVHFTAEAGKVYFYLINVTAEDIGNGFNMAFHAADRDEALYLIASDPQSVAKPKP